MWHHQHVLRDLIEAYEKVSIFALETCLLWTYKEDKYQKINNNEVLDTSSNKDHSFMTSIVENYDHLPSSKTMQNWSDIRLL